jgi:hypothetical protein
MKLRAVKDMTRFPVSVKIVGVEDPVPASVTTVAVLPDNSNRWFDPDRKEYPVDLTLSRTPANLKPGLTARVEMVLEHLSGVLAAPLGTVYSEDDDTWVFVRRGNKIVPQKVDIGQTTDTHAQIKSGIAAGDEIVLLEAGMGRQLLDKAGIPKKPPKSSTTRPVAATQPSTQAALQASTQPASQPSTRPTLQSSTEPASQPSTQPTLQASIQPSTAPTTSQS